VAEEALFLEHVGSSLLVGPAQLPWLHRLLLEAAATLAVTPPALYLRQASTPNAYTLALSGTRPAIVLHTALLELLNEAELQAVIAHELGHQACEHGVYLSLAAALAAPALSLGGGGVVSGFAADAAADALARWSRAAELSCDRAAALVARDPSVVASVLMKLAGGTPALRGQLSLEAFLEQARSYDAVAGGTLLGWALSSAQRRGASHPLPVARAAEIDRWGRTEQYKALLRQLPLHSAWPRAAGGGLTR
jgi:Zn-dependent protease with chaperone function